MTLVPEVADLLSAKSPGDGARRRGRHRRRAGGNVTAALMLGADGVLIGSRLVASAEAATPRGFHQALVAADGNSTVKTHTLDIARGYDWPDGYQWARAQPGIRQPLAWTRGGARRTRHQCLGARALLGGIRRWRHR